jgi:hypothetical protein
MTSENRKASNPFVELLALFGTIKNAEITNRQLIRVNG